MRIARPVLDLEAAARLLDELVLHRNERIVHTLERLADGAADTADIDKVRGGMNDLVSYPILKLLGFLSRDSNFSM